MQSSKFTSVACCSGISGVGCVIRMHDPGTAQRTMSGVPELQYRCLRPEFQARIPELRGLGLRGGVSVCVLSLLGFTTQHRLCHPGATC